MAFWKGLGEMLSGFFRGFGRFFLKFFGFLWKGGSSVFVFAGRIGWKHFFALVYVLLVLYGSVMVSIQERNLTPGLLYLGDSTFGLDSHITDVIEELKTDPHYLEFGVHKWHSLLLPTLEILGNLYVLYYLFWLWRKVWDLIPLFGDKSRPEMANILSFLFVGFVLKLLYFVITSNARGVVVDFFSARIWLDSFPLVFPLYNLLANFGFWFNSWFVPVFKFTPVKLGGQNISDLVRNMTGNSTNVSLQNVTSNVGV